MYNVVTIIDEETAHDEIEREFFDYENDMEESVCRESVSTNEEIEHSKFDIVTFNIGK
mgnify:FL=1